MREYNIFSRRYFLENLFSISSSVSSQVSPRGIFYGHFRRKHGLREWTRTPHRNGQRSTGMCWIIVDLKGERIRVAPGPQLLALGRIPWTKAVALSWRCAEFFNGGREYRVTSEISGGGGDLSLRGLPFSPPLRHRHTCHIHTYVYSMRSYRQCRMNRHRPRWAGKQSPRSPLPAIEFQDFPWGLFYGILIKLSIFFFCFDTWKQRLD